MDFNRFSMKYHSLSRDYLYIGITFLTLLFVSKISFGQEYNQNYGENTKPKKTFASHLFFGGGLGLQFGSITLIEISPIVGYKITPKFSIGLSPTYKYYSYNYTGYGKVNTNVFGGSIFSRYFIFENIFAHVEYETLAYNTKEPNQPTYMQQYNSFFVGGGYNQRIGGNSAMFILVLWNLNDTQYSPYSNPVIRVGFSVGL